VGIGASAGSLEVLDRFLDALPADSGMTLVVVQHLERRHPSALAELLGKHTRMPVQQAEDGIRPQPDHVYVIPPNAVLTLERGLLRIARPAETGLRTPIDAFFRSLAQDRGENAVGIIVSGAGTDGTAGLRAIKEGGGLTLAQSPETATYDSMPQSAIAAGLVDFTLPVEEMPARLQAYAASVTEVGRQGNGVVDAQVTASLGAICEILQRHTGHDFSHYKQGTLQRRIRRRIQIQQAASVADYVRCLEENAAEVALLHGDLLIGVTYFLRDPEVFAALAEQVIPTIMESGDASAPVRIWVPGCASGEEAYSIAILACEHAARVNSTRAVHIFATDIDGEALATARRGSYSDEIREHVSPERLERFFTREGATYQVSRELRELCTISEHSLIKDPPFSSLDLISCRNVLIYLAAELQKKLLPLFHYALRPGGYLLLGPSESLAGHPELFVAVDKKHRLFRRNDSAVRPRVEFPLSGRSSPRSAESSPPTPQLAGPSSRKVFSQAFERMVLEEYAPPCAVVNERGDILYAAGRTGRYLHVPVGVPTNNLLDLAPGSLRVELRTALANATKNRRKVVRENVPVEVDDRSRRLRLTVRPAPGLAADSGLFAVVLQEVGSADEPEAEEAAPASSEQTIVEQLENELRTTRAELQSAMEDIESSNEELKSSNEELVSTNEELQSANEELQTSKEEMQSANDELHSKVQELDAAESDLQHHYLGTQIATIFVDRELRITRVTPAATKLFNVMEGDVGRPIRDLAPRFVEEDLLPDLQTVIRTHTAVERRMHRADAAFLVRILPYSTIEKAAVTGAGATFVDITDLDRAEEAERRYGKLLQLSSDAIFIWPLDGGVETWNRGAEELYGYGDGEARGHVPRELLQAVLPRPWEEIEAALRENGRWKGEVLHRAKDGRTVTVSARFQLLQGQDGVARVLESDQDITEHKQTEAALREAIGALGQADLNKDRFLAMLSHELRNPLTPIKHSLYVLDRVSPASEQAKQAHGIIGRQIGHMARLIDDLLDVTRIARGKIQLQREPLDLRELVLRTVEDHRSAFVANGIELEVAVGDEAAQVLGDRTRLAQALGNLLSNAAKFTPSHGRTRITLERDAQAAQAIVRVRDTGAGVAANVLPHLFEPFVQGDGRLARTRGGLGLGLALVKGLVEMHGGTVAAHSDGPGAGAEFTIRLPIEGGPVAMASPGARRSAHGPLRVLIIEDNVDAVHSLRQVLGIGGHEIEVAYNGSEGLSKAREFKPDVVLCDIGLPEMDGYAVARAFRADEALRATRLVALTGYALPADVARAREAGFDEHLAKPPVMEKLEEALATETAAAEAS
jgi:two-component system CheB/CheR fusion protein